MNIISKLFPRDGAVSEGIAEAGVDIDMGVARLGGRDPNEAGEDSAGPTLFAPSENTMPFQVSVIGEPAVEPAPSAPRGVTSATDADEADDEEIPLLSISGPIDAPLSRDDVLERALRGETLERADLRGLDLREAILSGADFGRAILDEAKLDGAQLRKGQLRGATLREASLVGVDLREADLEGADLWGARLEGANLVKANLQRVNLTGANLSGANLTGARLEWAQLRAADLTGAILTDARAARAELDDARLERVTAVGLDASSASLCDATLARGDFARADFTDARLARVKAAGVRMPAAVLRKADLTDADLTDAVLTEADLRHVDLSGARLGAADLSGAKVAGLLGAGGALADVRADWLDGSTKGDGSKRVDDADGKARLLGRSLDATRVVAVPLPAADAPQCRYFGPGDVLRNATLSFGAGVRVEIDSLLENCTLELGEDTEVLVGAAGVLAGCKLRGPGHVTVAGGLFEGDEPTLEGVRSLSVKATGAVIGKLVQGPRRGRFVFERGCRMRLAIARGEAPAVTPGERTTPPGRATTDATVIDAGALSSGTLRTVGPVILRGSFEGELEAPSVEVAESGGLAGRTRVKEIRSRGLLGGEIDAETCELSGTLGDGAVLRVQHLATLADDDTGVIVSGCELVVGVPPTREEAIAKASGTAPPSAPAPLANAETGAKTGAESSGDAPSP